jgi:hypothetical protein
MVVLDWPQSVQTTVIGVLHQRPLDFFGVPDRRRRRDPRALCRPWPHLANVVEELGERDRARGDGPVDDANA